MPRGPRRPQASAEWPRRHSRLVIGKQEVGSTAQVAEVTGCLKVQACDSGLCWQEGLFPGPGHPYSRNGFGTEYMRPCPQQGTWGTGRLCGAPSEADGRGHRRPGRGRGLAPWSPCGGLPVATWPRRACGTDWGSPERLSGPTRAGVAAGGLSPWPLLQASARAERLPSASQRLSLRRAGGAHGGSRAPQPPGAPEPRASCRRCAWGPHSPRGARPCAWAARHCRTPAK